MATILSDFEKAKQEGFIGTEDIYIRQLTRKQVVMVPGEKMGCLLTKRGLIVWTVSVHISSNRTEVAAMPKIAFDQEELEDLLFSILWALDYVHGDLEQKVELEMELNRTAHELRRKLKSNLKKKI